MLSNVFFRTPRLTVMVLGLLLVGGLASVGSLPRQEDPVLTERFARILTFFPGASATRVEALVTDKIEEALNEVSEIKEVESTSRTGSSLLVIELDESVTDVDEVWSRVRDRLADVQAELPQGALVPEFEKSSITALTLVVGLTWDLPGDPELGILTRLAEELEHRLRVLPGADKTELFGAPTQEILVRIDPIRLASVNLTAAQVAAAIARADAKSPAGQLRGEDSDLVLEVSGELESLARIRSIPLTPLADGRVLRVGDIATVEKTLRTPPASLALIDGQRGIGIGVRMETDRRVDLAAAQGRAIVDAFAAEVPAGVKVALLFDQSAYTNARLSDLVLNLALGAAIVVGILFIMMGWRSALIVGSALPLTICMVLILFNILGVPLHQMSVSGLIISLGLLIDNAIVVIDDYNHHRRAGEGPPSAISKAVRHLFIPLLASTITTALTFAPIMLMPGAIGEFVGTIGLAVILSIFSSLFLAMTVVPSIAGYVDRRSSFNTATGGGLKGMLSDGIRSPAIAARYRAFLGLIVRRPFLGMGLAVVLPLFGFVAAGQLVEQFFPPTDRNQFQVQMTLPVQTSLRETQRVVEEAKALIDGHPAVVGSQWFMGEGVPKVYYNVFQEQDGVSNFAGAFVETRDAAATRTLLPLLQADLMAAFPQAEILTLPFEQGPPFDAPVEVRLFGPDLDILRERGEALRALMAEATNITYTRSQMASGRPKLIIVPDEDEVRLSGLNLLDVADELNASLEGVTGGTVMERTEELPVRVRVGEAFRNNVERLAGRLILNGEPFTGDREAGLIGVPLEAIGDMALVPEIDTIRRINGERVNLIQGFVVPFTLPGVALEDFRALLDAADFRMPPGYRLDFGGETAERDDSLAGLLAFVGPLVILMVGTIVLTFNSFRLAGIIGAVAVLSMGLSMLALWVFGYPMGFMAIIGTMGLIGLAINGAIVVLSNLKADAAAFGAADPAAICRVTVESTRHIVSTTLTTIGGFVPLIVWGGTFWPPLAIAIAGGVLGSAILALVFVPAAFTKLTTRRVRRERARRSREEAVLQGVSPAAAGE